MSDEVTEVSVEEIEEKDIFEKVEVEDVEGKVTHFFMGLLGSKKNKELEDDEPVDEEEDDFIEEEFEGVNNPFVRDGKLYGQDYDGIKATLLEEGKLFQDNRFPPSPSSLFYSSPTPSIGWKRPGEVCDEPKMFVDGADRFDINQGELGDCWLLAAMSSLAMNHTLLHQVMPVGQTFTDDYVGMFKFRFWQYGEWVDVVVDDFLPCMDGRLAYIHSHSKDEFWSALLEKAYAKLHGSYEALKGGSTCEAMVDFTGGCSEVYDLSLASKVPEDLFTIMQKGYQRNSLNGCSIKPDPDIFEAKTAVGLVKGHAYTISKVVKAKIETSRVKGKIPLVRVRNPWGNDTEWKGIWADGGDEWGFIPCEEQENLGITFESDGEWWMSHKDFIKHFDQLEICNLSPESMVDCDHDQVQWCVNTELGTWLGGETSGGCRNYLETFIHNPQYFVTLEEVDEDGDGEPDDLCTLIVSLMQKGRRALKHEGVGMLSIGFVIYKLNDPSLASEKLGEDFFKYNLSTARSASFINMREVTARFRLPPATYVIVPSTYDPGYEGEFMLRTFTEKPNTASKIE